MTAEHKREYREARVAAEWDAPDENDGEWPPPDRYIKRQVDGALAAAVRRRVGAAVDAPVFITECEMTGGYSEYTQETNYEMTVDCGGVSKDFWSDAENNLTGLLAWLDEPAMGESR